MKTILIILLNSLFLITLYSCEKQDPAKDNPKTSPLPSIGFSFVVTDADSNYLWRFPYYKDSPYDPRKIYWVSEFGKVGYPIYRKYRFSQTDRPVVNTDQIDNIDTGQLVEIMLSAELENDSVIRNGGYFYIHFPNGDIDTLFFNYTKQLRDSGYVYNNKYISWYKGGSKLSEYVGSFIIVK